MISVCVSCFEFLISDVLFWVSHFEPLGFGGSFGFLVSTFSFVFPILSLSFEISQFDFLFRIRAESCMFEPNHEVCITVGNLKTRTRDKGKLIRVSKKRFVCLLL